MLSNVLIASQSIVYICVAIIVVVYDLIDRDLIESLVQLDFVSFGSSSVEPYPLPNLVKRGSN